MKSNNLLFNGLLETALILTKQKNPTAKNEEWSENS